MSKAIILILIGCLVFASLAGVGAYFYMQDDTVTGSSGSGSSTGSGTGSATGSSGTGSETAGTASGSGTVTPMGPHRITGNNGTVSCRRFCNGVWGKGQLDTKFPGFVGADLAPGASNEALASDEGSCRCMMSKTTPWDTLENPGPHRVTGNNGTVSCRRFCNGVWGKGQLDTKFPGFVGADLAPGASNEAAASDEGSCQCMMSNTTPWETLQ